LNSGVKKIIGKAENLNEPISGKSGTTIVNVELSKIMNSSLSRGDLEVGCNCLLKQLIATLQQEEQILLIY
jgi:hypothetical protein